MPTIFPKSLACAALTIQPHPPRCVVSDELQITFALSRHVPDMERGFTIVTSFGDLQIPPGWMAELVREQLRQQLARQLKECRETALHGGAAD